MTTTTVQEGAGEFPQLLPCPFCGEPGEAFDVHTLTWHVRYGCQHCQVFFNDAETWNRRAQAPSSEQSAAQAAAEAPWFGDKSPLHQSLCMAPERCAECERIAGLAATPAPAHPLPVAGEEVLVEAVEQWFAVLNPPRNEGVIFKSKRDATFAATGNTGGVFGVPTIAHEFREAYEYSGTKFEMVEVSLIAHAAPAGEKGGMQ